MLNNKRSKNIYCSVVTLLFAMVQSQLTVAAAQMYFVHNDQLGTPVAVTDQSQAVVWEADKKPFGESVIMGTVGENTRFPGQVFDEETGLHYNYYRDYDPSLGRYIQSDPIGILRDYSDPQVQVAISMGVLEETESAGELLNHSYGYVGQNPLFWIDPYGLAGRKGERGYTGKSSGTKNPFKHMKPHPTDPSKVIVKDPQTGKKIVKPKPPGFTPRLLLLVLPFDPTPFVEKPNPFKDITPDC